MTLKRLHECSHVQQIQVENRQHDDNNTLLIRQQVASHERGGKQLHVLHDNDCVCVRARVMRIGRSFNRSRSRYKTSKNPDARSLRLDFMDSQSSVKQASFNKSTLKLEETLRSDWRATCCSTSLWQSDHLDSVQRPTSHTPVHVEHVHPPDVVLPNIWLRSLSSAAGCTGVDWEWLWLLLQKPFSLSSDFDSHF